MELWNEERYVIEMNEENKMSGKLGSIEKKLEGIERRLEDINEVKIMEDKI